MKAIIATTVLGAALGGAAGGAWAHGSADHKAPKPAQMHAEQTPFGIAADARRATRTIKIDMSDAMRFSPAQLSVRQGETVRFVVTNSGKVMHELVLGTLDKIQKHAELMRKFPDMEHDEPHMVHVAPGKTGELVWSFNRAGVFQYACLIPGHFEAGMVGSVRVVASDASTRQAPAVSRAADSPR